MSKTTNNRYIADRRAKLFNMHLAKLTTAALAAMLLVPCAQSSFGQDALWRQVRPKDAFQTQQGSPAQKRNTIPMPPVDPAQLDTSEVPRVRRSTNTPNGAKTQEMIPVPELVIRKAGGDTEKQAEATSPKVTSVVPTDKNTSSKNTSTNALDPFAPDSQLDSNRNSTDDPFSKWLGVTRNPVASQLPATVIPAPNGSIGPQPVNAPYTPGSIGSSYNASPMTLAPFMPLPIVSTQDQAPQSSQPMNQGYPGEIANSFTNGNMPPATNLAAPAEQIFFPVPPPQLQIDNLPPLQNSYPQYPQESAGIPNGGLTIAAPNQEFPAQEPLAPTSPQQEQQPESVIPQFPQPSPINEQPLETVESNSPRMVESIIPIGFQPWWQQYAIQPIRPQSSNIPVDINSLICDTLRFSARIRAVSDNAAIARTAITRSAADFDPYLFAETKFNKVNVPTGSSLDAGAGIQRLKEENWFYSAGVRRKNQLGSKLEASQKIGTRDSNSTFFNPQNQGNARLSLSFNQPILQGAGRPYNTSLIVLAKIESDVSMRQTATELQDHLLEVTQSLWDLYLYRAGFLQKQRNAFRAGAILERLNNRRSIDSLDSQIARARAAVATRNTALIRAETVIRNVESELRSQVNSPNLISDRSSELVPLQAPFSDYISVNAEEAVITALENRPEIDVATKELEAARVRSNVAKNELLPVLDLVLESYLSGLRGNYDIGQSLADQFSVGRPSYSAGMIFEMPLGRRAAGANNQRRLLEIRKLTSQYEATVQTLISETEIAVREVDTSFRELQARFESLNAAEADLQYLERRWEMLPGDDRAASFLLADLLDSQDRLTEEEFSFTKAQVAYAISLTKLNRATGMLLQHERIELVSSIEDGLPTERFEKQIQNNSADLLRE